MDLTKPIDITAVNNTAVKYNDVLKGLNKMKAEELLSLLTPYPGIQDSVVIGRTEHGEISKKYTGTFGGDKQIGKIVPRTLQVKPCVMEMSDEPERYRRTFIARVAGNMWDKAHPFEQWILQFGYEIASEELYNAIFTAVLDDTAGKEALTDSFDGYITIIEKEKTALKLTAALKNMYVSGVITAANAGDKLLGQWRTAHKTLKNKQTVMLISNEVGEMYDDWYTTEHQRLPLVETAELQYLEGTNKRCRLVRVGGMPAGSQMVILSTTDNLIYGYDKPGDFNSIRAFNSGNPYRFTAAGKYVFGVQIESIHERCFVVNDQPGVPA